MENIDAPGTPFCVPGGHPIEPGKPWRMVRASKPGTTWISNHESRVQIIVCEDHPVIVIDPVG